MPITIKGSPKETEIALTVRLQCERAVDRAACSAVLQISLKELLIERVSVFGANEVDLIEDREPVKTDLLA